MYGVEASTGLGGLGAQVPGGDRFLPGALAIRSRSGGLIGGPADTGLSLPYAPGVTPAVSPGGGAVEHPVEQMHGGWRQILDFHNSPAPWILALILLHYAWTHVERRRR